MAERSAHGDALDLLNALVGEWESRASVDGRLMARSHSSFAWLEGGAFITQRSTGEAAAGAAAEWVTNLPFPTTMVIGFDDESGQFSCLYADARGVRRIYQMILSGSVWRLWRDAPGFFQRFTGEFGDDGDTISGRWERSADGANWQPDFDLTYTRVG